jgi:hypothetical protein
MIKTSSDAIKQQLSLSDNSAATLLRLVWAGSNVVVAIMLLWVVANQYAAANKSPAPYAISRTGEKLAIQKLDPQTRSETIKNFVNETFVGIYTWGSTLPPANPQQNNVPVADAGIAVKDDKGQDLSIPTSSFIATLALEPNLAKAYQQEIALYVRKLGLGAKGDKSETVFIPRQTSEPISVGQDTWLVNIVGAQMIRSGSTARTRAKTTVINHGYQVTVRSVPTIDLSDAMAKYQDRDLAAYAAKIRSSELEITKITPLERLANAEAKSAMGGTDKAFASHLQPVSTTSPAPRTNPAPVKAKPITKPSPPIAKTPPPQTKIVYRTITAKPTPVKPVPVKRTLGKPMPPPSSFISLGKGQQPSRQEKQSRPKREPLASEKTLLDNLDRSAPAATAGADPLKAGQNTSVHLMSTLQFNDRGDTPLQVMLDRPLVTLGTKQIPAGSIILFQASVNPQNGAITAISGDAVVNGKTVRIQKGAMSLELSNPQRTSRAPLVAQSVNLKEGELATADRNNALVGIAGGIGKELTKGTANVTVGNGSTIIQQGNNSPNIWGGALNGASETILNNQRQRIETKASQALAAPPIQSLAADTPLLLTVTFPAPIDR